MVPAPDGEDFAGDCPLAALCDFPRSPVEGLFERWSGEGVIKGGNDDSDMRTVVDVDEGA